MRATLARHPLRDAADAFGSAFALGLRVMTTADTKILFLGNEDAVLRNLASQSETTLWWARTAEEAKSVLAAESRTGVLPTLVRSRNRGRQQLTADLCDMGVEPTPTADLTIDTSPLPRDILISYLGGDTERAPWWLPELVESLTPTEIYAARIGEPGWAVHALNARLLVGNLRAQAGIKTLTKTHFAIVLDVCRVLTELGRLRPAEELVDVARARAEIYRQLFSDVIDLFTCDICEEEPETPTAVVLGTIDGDELLF